MDGGMYSYRYLVAQLAVALGGRVAEEMAFGSDDVTTGASNDLQQVRGRSLVGWWPSGASRRPTSGPLGGL